MTNNKLPEVGEFWDAGSGCRRKIVFTTAIDCVVMNPSGLLNIWSRLNVATNWTYLPWCKSFDDAEPKPQTEEVEFREYALYGELRWLSYKPSDAIPTGFVRKIKVTK